jgi:60 kDa SS-A/Ro ribonucleoprotein
MQYALKNKIPVDCFVIYTDNETWAGGMHPVKALEQYRKEMKIPAKLIVQAFTATSFSIADPMDGGMLDIAGLDSAVPQVMKDFILQGF